MRHWLSNYQYPNAQNFRKNPNFLLSFFQELRIKCFYNTSLFSNFYELNDTAQKCQYLYNYSCNDDEVPNALAAMNTTKLLDPNWYAYIGGTAHMTSNPGTTFLFIL